MPVTVAVQPNDITTGWNEFWRSVVLFVPRAVGFVVILIIGYIIARLVLKGVDAVLERVGFDRAVERGGVGRALERTRYDASDILARLAYYAVLLFTLQFAFGIWGRNPISDLISEVVRWLPRAFVAIIIVVIASAIASAVRDLVTGALGGLSYGRILADVASIFIIALGVIAALNQIGVATTVTTPVLVAVLATIAGILIVGIGGGLVRPMQQRLDGWLKRIEEETRQRRGEAYAAGRGDVERQAGDRAGGAARQPAGTSATGAPRGGESGGTAPSGPGMPER